jgi:selenocysteine lyase/cysteine desulfurase
VIYLDNAATTIKKPPEVLDAVMAAMSGLGNASRGAHAGALDASRAVYDARVKAAAFFGCPRPDHVAFTSNSTEALNVAICGTLRPGDHVITTALEHNSVLRPLYRLEAEQGVALDIVGADPGGRVDYGAFERLIRPQTRAIVCTHASNLTGICLDVAYIGAIARRHGVLFIVDASQSAGAIPIHMTAMGIDILCFTGHKGLMGPQGTGGLCVREGVDIRPLKVGGTGVHTYSKEQPSQWPTRLEAGTLNAHGIAGLSAAFDFLERTGLDAIMEKESALLYRFLRGIGCIDGIEVYGAPPHLTASRPASANPCINRSAADGATPTCLPRATAEGPHTAVCALNIRDRDPAWVADELSETYGIATRAGAHCAPLMHRALGTEGRGAVRFSFSYFTTEDEIDAAIDALGEIAR